MCILSYDITESLNCNNYGHFFRTFWRNLKVLGLEDGEEFFLVSLLMKSIVNQ